MDRGCEILAVAQSPLYRGQLQDWQTPDIADSPSSRGDTSPCTPIDGECHSPHVASGNSTAFPRLNDPDSNRCHQFYASESHTRLCAIRGVGKASYAEGDLGGLLEEVSSTPVARALDANLEGNAANLEQNTSILTLSPGRDFPAADSTGYDFVWQPLPSTGGVRISHFVCRFSRILLKVAPFMFAGFVIFKAITQLFVPTPTPFLVFLTNITPRTDVLTGLSVLSWAVMSATVLCIGRQYGFPSLAIHLTRRSQAPWLTLFTTLLAVNLIFLPRQELHELVGRYVELQATPISYFHYASAFMDVLAGPLLPFHLAVSALLFVPGGRERVDSWRRMLSRTLSDWQHTTSIESV